MKADEVLYTSDTHFGHKRILVFQKDTRPFGSVQEMDEALVERWNNTVKPGQHVFHCGDVSFLRTRDHLPLLERLHGVVHLIRGNHDKGRHFPKHWIEHELVHNIEVDGQPIVLCHFPILSWERAHKGVWHLHGHCHGKLAESPTALRIDIGVDAWDKLRPFTHAEVAERMKNKTFQPVDGHGRDEVAR